MNPTDIAYIINTAVAEALRSIARSLDDDGTLSADDLRQEADKYEQRVTP